MLPKLLDRYIFKAILPYTALSLLILTILLLIQQTTRLSELLGAANAPLSMISEVFLNLLPNILVFTLPMATLVGTATGFSRMGYDSELVSMRAGGVGTLSIVAPALLFGLCVGALALFTGFRLAPSAAHNIREATLRAALRRLESPVEPRTFYTGMPGKVIYVREGDQETGEWKGIFIHWQEANGPLRIVTARAGKIDASGAQTELALEDAVVTTLPASWGGAETPRESVTTQHSAALRVRDERLSESRDALLRRIEGRELEPDELGWEDLRKLSHAPDPKRSADAQLALHRRLSFCLAPLGFAFLGSVLGLRIGRRGRSYGILLSLLAMFVYYLISLGGEQLARARVIQPWLGSWLAFTLMLGAGLLLAAFGTQMRSVPILRRPRRRRPPAAGKAKESGPGRRRLVAFLGLLDRDLLRSLVFNFLLSFISLTFVFLVFTLFELLRFVVQSRTGYQLVAQYLLYLLPYVWVFLIPIGTLLAVMITFALLVRRGEALVWWASGQSTFRLVLPCMLLAAALACAHWFLQESVMPGSNRRQNALRAQIKGGISQSETSRGRFWINNPESRRIYTFESGEGGGSVSNLTVYEFDEGDLHLRRLISGARGAVEGGNLKVGEAQVLEIGAGGAARRGEPFEAGAEELGLFKRELNRPSEYDTVSLSEYITELKRRGEDTTPLAVALERRRADPLASFVMVFVSAPLALFFGRRSTVAALCAAVALGLSFWAVVSGLQQLGAGGLLPPKLAAWAPTFIYTVLGLYLLARAKT
ncbi:MAG TPA: LptF/LptG family permease [Pyrinomonadaceae bacterium]|jgi:LPS export ABC transporter permease LptF/LPS export ABC transporter permease LptG|nr:LptF/LptG family permease [Pyrinomonadaceae bacterium]